ncbi:hypothetical protein [Thauera humireducens]|uniref:Uncharacterized protein n=1 Tax=Thauera humireducens TaxID=1134435 RepID=A0A140ICN0_9RHOO|nr:hypothetical protein [Thauera humireducens]AMO35505.1 hypothetical protein AC731_000155 [Thauera humireducens]CAH1745457.1 conserved membrane protein of unknown function [Thauera humireducens]
MVFDVSVALNWILFLALFPIAFFWLRRAWRIMVKRDFSEVALKRGESPQNPARYAPFAAAINLIGGGIVVFVIFGILTARFDFETWSAIAGSTIWMKFIFDFILSRQAHPMVLKKRNKQENAAGDAGK